MESFRPLTEADNTIVKEYLDKNYIECTYIVDSFEKYGLSNDYMNKKCGKYYGYFVEDKMVGVFVFNNMGVLSCHYVNDSILNKIILLKTIKAHKPVHILGINRCIEPVIARFDKVFRWDNYNPCKFMVLDTNKYESYSGNKHMIINAVEFDFNSSVDFLIKMESDFRNKTKTINDFKNYITDKNHVEYIYAVEGGKTLAQGLIKVISKKIELIEAIYTLREYRNMGFAKTIVSVLSDRVLDKDKIPGLIVHKRNNEAISLYEQLGFITEFDYITVDVEV